MSKLSILLFFCCCTFFSQTYAQDASVKREVMFEIFAIYQSHDTIIAVIKNAKRCGVKVNNRAIGYTTYISSKNNGGIERSSAPAGTGRVVTNDTLTSCYIKLYDTANSLREGDLIGIEINLPVLPERSVLSDLALNRIFLMDNRRDDLYSFEGIFFGDTKARQDSIYAAMQISMKEVYDMILGTEQGNQLSVKMKTGNYIGYSVMDLLKEPKKEDLESFMFFIYSFPGKYMGFHYKVSETYATWLINDAPKSHKEVINKLFPIYKNKPKFLAALQKYRHDVIEDGHVESICDEVIRLFKKNDYENAAKLNDFARAIAYEVNDTSGKARYWLLEAERTHYMEKYAEAIPFCDSSLYYSRLAGNKDMELDGLSKSLYCRVYARQYKEAKLVAEVFGKKLEAYKGNIPKEDYNKNLVKLHEYYGNALYNQGDYGKALEEFKLLTAYNESINTYDAQFNNGRYYKFIGQINNEQGLPNEALKSFEKAARTYRINADTTKWATVLSEIAYSYNKKSSYVQSLIWCDSAATLSKKAGDLDNVGYAYSLAGSNYWELGKYDSAVAAHKQSIGFRKLSGNKSGQANSWYNIGELYLLSGSKPLALNAYDSSAFIYKDLKDSTGLAKIYNKKGVTYANDENYKEAVKNYEMAKGISTGSTEDALYNLGNVWTSIDSDKSKQYYEQCIKSCKQSENSGLEFSATYALTSLLYYTKNYAAADQLLKTCYKMSEVFGTASSKADCYALEGYGLKSKTELDAALVYLNKAMNIYDTVSQSSKINQLNSIGDIYISKGEFELAEKAYKEAIALAKQTQNNIAQGSSLQAYSFLSALTGDFENGLRNNDSALYIFKKSGNVLRMADTYVSRGTVLEGMGSYDKAVQSFQKADSIYIEQGMEDNRYVVFTDMGVVYFKQSDYDNAYKFHKMAYDKQNKAAADESYLLSAGNLAEVLLYQKKYKEAEKILVENIPLAKAKKANRVLSGMDITLGTVYYETKQLDKSKTYFTDAYTYGISSGEKEKTISALTYLGLLNEQEKKQSEAEKNYKEAITLSSAYNIASGWQPFYQLGLLYYQQNKYDSAIVYFKKAIRQLDKNTENLYGGESAAKLYNNDPRKTDLYNKITFAYYNLGDVKEAWNYANRSNIAGIKELAGTLGSSSDVQKNEALKKLLSMQQQKKQLEETLEKQTGAAREETLKKIEIQENKYNSFLEDVIDKYPELSIYFKGTNADEFNTYKKKLPADVAVLLYVVNNNTLMIFSLTNEKLAVDTMTLNIDNNINEFIATIKNTGIKTGTGSLALRSEPVDEEPAVPAKDFKNQSAELYRILIGSIEDKIKGKSKLCIIPSGIFSNLPFQCLGRKTSNNGFRFLIEDHNVFYTNKMSIFNGETAKPDNAGNLKSFAAFGVPDATLAYNLTEVKEIGKILKNEKAIYADSRATESLAKESLLQKKYIHFATHGILTYSTKYSQSYLKLLPDSDTTTGNNGKLTLREIQDLGIQDCNMVILSACETAVSMQAVKGWNISPANSFLISNVKTVVASLWKVADEPTGLLMQYFYENLSAPASMNKLDALRQAQIKLSQNPKFSHPNYWGAFVLYGDWQ